MRVRLLLLALLAACAGPAVRAPARPAPAAADDDVDPALLAAAGVDPAALRCNSDNAWGDSLRPDSEAAADDIMAAIEPALKEMTPEARAEVRTRVRKLVFWRLVRAVLIEGDMNNLGVVRLGDRTYVDQAGVARPLLVFRTGLTPSPDQPGSCFRSLLEGGGVRHVINLFDGDIPVADLVAAEERAAAAAGASYVSVSDEGYGPWRDQLRKSYDDPAVRAQATAAVARLIREQILRPGGATPRGNIHLHCGGGMHRSGMIVGVLERCAGGLPMATVEAHYKRHVGWRDAEHPGGYEEGNVRFIREFDCSLLTR
jgi:hypothetical protein